MLMRRHLFRWIVVTVGVCLLLDFGRALSQDAKPLIITGELTASDPFDKVRTKSHCKVHELELKAGESYAIELKSSDFDTFLRVEDAAGKKIAENDGFAAIDRSSRVVVEMAAKYRAVVTSYEGGKTGKYAVELRTASPADIQEQSFLREAILLSVRGLKLKNEGNYKGALPPLQQALERTDKLYPKSRYPKGHPNLASALHNLAELFRSQGQYAEAEFLHKQALEIKRQVLGEQHPSFSSSLYSLALLYQSQANYALAESLYKQSVEIDRRVLGEKHPDFANSLNGLAGLYVSLGDHAKAESLFKESLEITRRALGEKHTRFAATLNNLARLYYNHGDYAKAEPLYKQALDIWRQALGERHPDFATGLNNLASLYRSQGDYAKAEPLYKQALEIRRLALGEKHSDFARSLNNLAQLYYNQGDYAKAEPPYKQAMEIWRLALGEKHPDYAASLNNLASLYDSQGDYAKAEPLHKRALEIRRQVLGEKHPSFGASLNNLALLYQSQGDYAKAEPLHKQALEIWRRVLGEQHPDFAASLNNLAALYRSQGDYRKAELLHKQSLEIRRRALGEKHPDFAMSLNNLGLLYHSEGAYAKAEPLLNQSLEIRRQVLGEKHPDFALSLNNLAFLYQSQGDYARAEPLGQQAVQIVREHLEGAALAQSERQQIAHREKSDGYYRNYVRTTAKVPTAVESTVDLVLSWKGAVTARQRLTRIARSTLDNDPEAKELFQHLDNVARQISVWSAKGPTKGVDLPKKLAELSAERETVEAKLSAHTEAFRRLKASQDLTAAQLQKLLPEGTVLIDFVEYLGNLAAFVVTKDQFARVELGPTKPLQEAADRFRQALKRPLAGKDDPGQVLREKILAPLEKYAAGAKLLLIAPDGPLHSLPFAALPGKAPGTYLIEEVPVAVIPVPQMLPELLAKRSPSAESAPSLLALGDVDFDVNPTLALAKGDGESWKRRRAGSQQNWDRLPGTRGEILAIEDTFRKAVPQGKLTVLRDAQPTETAVRKLASGYEYLHFATHGFFAGKEVKSALSPPLPKGGPGGLNSFEPEGLTKVLGHHPGLLSGIVLAGANKPKEDDDGVLTALEVSELDLTKVELAVLSACETGLGEVAGGEGVLGLQRAFQIAGARSTITSLWKVDDEATRKLMERFYDNYWKKNMGTLEALRESQLWMLREGASRGIVRVDQQSDSKGRAAPYYWAAFVLSGDWR